MLIVVEKMDRLHYCVIEMFLRNLLDCVHLAANCAESSGFFRIWPELIWWIPFVFFSYFDGFFGNWSEYAFGNYSLNLVDSVVFSRINWSGIFGICKKQRFVELCME